MSNHFPNDGDWPPRTKTPPADELLEIEWNVKGWKRATDQKSWKELVKQTTTREPRPPRPVNTLPSYSYFGGRGRGRDCVRPLRPTNVGIHGRALPASPILDIELLYSGRIGKLYMMYGGDSARIATEFLRTLLVELRRKRIEIDEIRCPQPVNLREEVAQKQFIFKEIAKETANDAAPSLILYVDPLTKGTHGQLKLLESLLQLRTQHVNTEVLELIVDGDFKITRSIVRQINMKIGGVNIDMGVERFSSFGWLSHQTMIVAYCIAFPKEMGKNGSHPSIVGLSANCSVLPGAYVGDFHFQEAFRGGRGVALDHVLNTRMHWFLKLYQKNRGRLPEHIVVVRDGVHEEDLENVTREEVRCLKAACLGFQNEYDPKLVVVGASPNNTYSVLESYIPSIPEWSVVELLSSMNFTHQLGDNKINRPKPLYEAVEWTKRGARIFNGYRDSGFALPRDEQNNVDWEKMTSMLSYMGKKLEGLRVKA